MFCSRKSNNLINKIHERSLGVVNNDKNSNFEDLLMTEVFRIINRLSPPIMDNFFTFHENAHNIRNFQIISNEHKKTLRYGQNTIKFRTLHYGQTYLKNINLPIPRTLLKEKLKTGNAQHAPVGYDKLIKKILVLSNFTYLFIYLFFYYLFHCYSDVSSVSHTVERKMNEFSTCEFKW